MVICHEDSCEVTLNEKFTMHMPSNNFLSIFFSVSLVSIFSLQYTDGCICSIINDCTTACTFYFCWKINVIDKCLLCVPFLNWNRQYRCIHKHHHQFSWGFQRDPLVLSQYLIQLQWSLQMIHIHIFPTLPFLCPSSF